MGRNARIRKEKRIIEKYGALPKERQPIAWGKVAALLLVVAMVILGAKDLSHRIVPAYAKAKTKLASLARKAPKTTASPQSKISATVAGATTEKPIDKKEQKMSATISTSLGDITVELYQKDAPKTVENFQKLAEKGYYNGVIFHRVIKDFMIQGGDPTGTGRGGESIFGRTFEDEINSHKIVAGTLAMANAGPNTNGSQFFIVTEQPQPHLDGKHTVFGQVESGMDVVKKIAAVPVDENDKPKQDVKITGIKIQTQ